MTHSCYTTAMAKHKKKKRSRNNKRQKVDKTTSSSKNLEELGILQKIIIFLFHILLFTVPLFFLSVNDELFEFNKMILTYGITTLIASVWATRMVFEKRFIWKQTPLDIPILLFFISQVASTIFSIHFRTSVYGYYTRFHGGLLSTITYITLYYAFVSNTRKKDIRNLTTTLLASGIIVSIYAVLEHFGHSLSCLFITQKFDVSCWVQDVQTRVFATFGQPNWLAAFLVMIIPVSIWKTLQALSCKKQGSVDMLRFIIWMGSTLLFFITLLYTRSRSGIAALAIGLSFFGVWMLIRFVKTIIRQTKKDYEKFLKHFLASVCIGVMFLLITAIEGTPFTPNLNQLLSRHTQEVPETTQEIPTQQTNVNRLEIGGTDSGEIRKIVWQGAFDIWRRYPLLGSGVETFAYSYYKDRPMEHNLVSEWDFLYNKAHNEFLNMLATTGIIGFGSYLIFILSVMLLLLYYTFKQTKANNTHYPLLMFSSLLALHVSNFFGFSTVMVSILMWLLPAMAIMMLQDDESKNEGVMCGQSSINDTWQYVLLSLIGMISVILAYNVARIWYADFLFARAQQYSRANYFQEAQKRFQAALAASPKEGVFYEKYSLNQARYAIALAQSDYMDMAQQVAEQAIAASDESIRLNSVHVNFYKTRTRVLLTLSQAQPQLLEHAKITLLAGLQLAPTDAKLQYNLGLVEQSLGENDQALLDLEKAVTMKPNYEAARYNLGKMYEEIEEYEKAQEQYSYILKNISSNKSEVQTRLDAVATRSGEKE